MYTVPTLPYVRLCFTLEAEEAAHLPPYHGSMLRGAFGHALRDTVCAMGPDQACYPCPLRPNCVYPRLFETFLDDDPPPFLKGLKTAPRPYVFEPLSEDQELAPGDILPFDLVLVGQAVELQGYVIVAVERMAPRGLGRGRKRFRVLRVEAPEAGVVLYQDGSWTTRDPVPATEPPTALPDQGSMELAFETPVRSTRDGECQVTRSFTTLGDA